MLITQKYQRKCGVYFEDVQEHHVKRRLLEFTEARLKWSDFLFVSSRHVGIPRPECLWLDCVSFVAAGGTPEENFNDSAFQKFSLQYALEIVGRDIVGL